MQRSVSRCGEEHALKRHDVHGSMPCSAERMDTVSALRGLVVITRTLSKAHISWLKKYRKMNTTTPIRTTASAIFVARSSSPSSKKTYPDIMLFDPIRSNPQDPYQHRQITISPFEPIGAVCHHLFVVCCNVLQKPLQILGILTFSFVWLCQENCDCVNHNNNKSGRELLKDSR